MVSDGAGTKGKQKPTKQDDSSNQKPQSEKEMRKEADAILNVQLALFRKTKDLWASSSSSSSSNPDAPSSKELPKHMKAVRNSYTAFNKFPYHIKLDYRRKMHPHAVTSGTLGVACEVIVKGLKENSYMARGGSETLGGAEAAAAVVKEQADLLSNCLQTVSSYTDTSPDARQAVVEHRPLLPLLVEKLDEWYQPHMDGTRLVSTSVVSEAVQFQFRFSLKQEM